MERPLVLGIETSCDDTACALLDGEGRILSSVVSSQLAAHRPFGGVVPEIASREHLTNWPAVSSAALAEAGVGMPEVDVVAATRGPGLVGALLVGLSLGKAIAWALGRQFHAVHHLEGHLYSPFLRERGVAAEPPPERFVGLVVSGGHTTLFGVERAAIATLAETRDDAIGEAFDKVGKRLGLAYPQGPRVDELAEGGRPGALKLSIAAPGKELFFSYSGLKTQALVELDRLGQAGVEIPPPAREPAPDGAPEGPRQSAPESAAPEFPQPILDLLAAFREAAVGQLLDRLTRLHRRSPFDLLAVSGGVAANRHLRRLLPTWAAGHGVELRLVPLAFCGDNAAMIAHAALLRHRRGLADDPLAAEAASRIPVG